jgi:RimJ/RimL family protein N-acetyltransferase
MVQLKDGEVIAGICYDNFNGHNIMMHVAAKPKIRWITRQLLHEAFKYPFITLGCQRITGWVEASNMEAQKLNHHLGFVAEARMERAAADGGDVILYRMFREHCRYA